jgi:hypothetical protein
MAANSGFAGFTGHRQAGGNFCAIEGLTSYSITTNNRGFIGNYNLEIGKKYYWEVRAKSFGGTQDQLFIGVCKDDIDLTDNRGGGQVSGGGYGFENYNNLVYLSSSSSSGSGPGQYRSPPNNVRVKVDRVNHTISWALDDGSFSSTYSIPSTGRLYPWLGSGGGTNTAEARANFGQDSTFSGDLTAQTNTDENGFGEFYYSVPSGFVACCNGNRSVSADIDPNLTDDNYPGKNFNVVEYTGNATTGQSITGMGFKPDLLICKMTSSSQNWQVYDSSRLNTRSTPFGLRFDTEGAEFDDQSTGNNNKIISTFDTDGFTLGQSGSGPNDSGRTYDAFGFRANGGTVASNSSGSTTSSVQANTKAGFSIVTYSGSLTSSGTKTVGHGLSQAPEFIIRKGRNQTGRWAISHVGCTSFNYMLDFEVAGEVDKSSNGSMSAPTTTVFSNNYTQGYDENGINYVAYCWHSVAGYSSFGSYTGSGQEDGTYIDLGFRPRWIFIKKISESSTTYGWANFNTEHQKFNKQYFSGGWFDTSAAFSSNYPFAILGNGFKHRNNNTNLDASGKTYIYGAWGDIPAKYNNGF